MTSQASPAPDRLTKGTCTRRSLAEICSWRREGWGGCWAHFRHISDTGENGPTFLSPPTAHAEHSGRRLAGCQGPAPRPATDLPAPGAPGAVPASSPPASPRRPGCQGGTGLQELPKESGAKRWWHAAPWQDGCFLPSPAPCRPVAPSQQATGLVSIILPCCAGGAAAGRGVHPKAGGHGAASAALVAGLGASPISSASGRAGSVRRGARGEPGQATQSRDLPRTWDGASCLGAPQLLCTLRAASLLAFLALTEAKRTSVGSLGDGARSSSGSPVASRCSASAWPGRGPVLITCSQQEPDSAGLPPSRPQREVFLQR